jgi:hypothetical protein
VSCSSAERSIGRVSAATALRLPIGVSTALCAEGSLFEVGAAVACVNLHLSYLIISRGGGRTAAPVLYLPSPEMSVRKRTHATSALLPPIAAPKMLRAAARAAACSGAGVAALSRRNMASSAGSTSVHSFSGTLLDGRPLQLATLAGRPALIVNVASE